MGDNDNFLDMLRRQKLITPDFNPGEENVPTPAPAPTLTDKYISEVQNIPKYSDYHPSLKRRIAGALLGAGTGSPQVAKNIVDEPYNKKLLDYSRQLGGLGQAAGMENTLNINRARISELTQRALMDAARASQERSTAKLRDYQATPEHDLRVHGYHPQNSEEYFKSLEIEHPEKLSERYKSAGQGIMFDTVTGKYISGSEFDRIRRDFESRTGAEYARINAYKERTGKMGSKSTSPKYPDSTHQATARKLAMDKLSADPKYSKFFTYGPDKKTRVLQPPSEGFFFGASKEDKKNYKDLVNKIELESKRILGSDFTIENNEDEENYDIQPIDEE